MSFNPKSLSGVVRRAFVENVRKNSFDLSFKVGKKKQEYVFFESKAKSFKIPFKAQTVWCLFYGDGKNYKSPILNIHHLLKHV